MTEINQQIQWLEKSSRLSDLRPYESNPRHISDTQYKKLKDSIESDGYHARIKATIDGRVIGGHQRLRALKELGYDTVQILVPDRELTDEQFKSILIRDNVSNGFFDMDMLANEFDLEELRDFGVSEVMDIAPFDTDDESHMPGKVCVRCPGCGMEFPTKGNKV